MGGELDPKKFGLSGKKVKRWEGETIISEELESTKDIKNHKRSREMWKYKRWIKEME